MTPTSAQKPITIAVLGPDGLQSAPFTAYSLSDASDRMPDGVYTTVRTFRGDHALLLDAHLDRLEESARLAQIALVWDRARLRAALRDLLHQAGYPDAKFRITVPAAQPDHLYLSLEPFAPVPPEVMAGAHLATLPMARENPIAKKTDWMTIRKPAYEGLPPGVYEGLLMDEAGYLLEGFSTNFYAVLNGELRTAGEGVLEGITRRAVLEIVQNMSDALPLRLEAIHRDDLPAVSEAFFTSSSRGVVPVVRVDANIIGDGQMGPHTARIQREYDAWTDSHIEPI